MRDLKGRFKKGHSQSNTGKTHFEKGHIPYSKIVAGQGILVAWNKGKKMPQISGKNHPKWKGVISLAKDYKNFYKKQYKHRKRNATGSHTKDEWNNLKKQHNFSCVICKKREPKVELTEDHIIPVSKGGSNNIENIQPLCRSCNGRKKDKINI